MQTELKLMDAGRSIHQGLQPPLRGLSLCTDIQSASICTLNVFLSIRKYNQSHTVHLFIIHKLYRNYNIVLQISLKLVKQFIKLLHM